MYISQIVCELCTKKCVIIEKQKQFLYNVFDVKASNMFLKINMVRCERTVKKIKPLTELTGGKHGPLVCASSEFILDEIEEALAKMNILSKKDE